MNSKSDHKEIKINDKLAEVIENYSLIDNIIIWKHEWGVVILSLIVFAYCIINVINKIRIVVDHIKVHLPG